jgi:hypothetical protein
MADFAELKAEVERIKAVRPSIVAIINGIADKVAAAVAANDAGDNSELASLSADVRAEADAFEAVAVTITPAEPPA